METPLNATAITAGALMSASSFVVPPFQREYAWSQDEVAEFWSDLRSGVADDSYFLGLVILTDEKGDDYKHVVDGQQRILTLTMLAAALYHEATRAGRRALADRINADFLNAISYETDRVEPRVRLSDARDDATFQEILNDTISVSAVHDVDQDSLSPLLARAYGYLRSELQKDLGSDPFKRLGVWADFLTNHLYFAVFVHPDPASAYRVFEVINTRGRELTTADLLKNYILSQTPAADRTETYHRWKSVSRAIEQSSSAGLVQYIRHVTSVRAGYVLPRDLFDYLSGRLFASGKDRRRPPSAEELLEDLERWIPLYLQLVDHTVAGPAESSWLGVFGALNDLNVVSVRPVIMAITEAGNAEQGLRELLKLVARRIVVGNLGTGNVERRFSEAARKISESGSWRSAFAELDDLNPSEDDFVEQLRKRSLNKGSLTFLRRSIVQQSPTPSSDGFLHLVRPRQAPDWQGFPDDAFTFWGSTIGNTFLARSEGRPKPSGTWSEFRSNVLPLSADGEFVDELESTSEWTTHAVERIGRDLAERAAQVWYGGDSRQNDFGSTD